MKKIIALVLSVVMVVLALASCGGNATTGTTAGTKNTGTTAGTTTAAGTTGTNGTTGTTAGTTAPPVIVEPKDESLLVWLDFAFDNLNEDGDVPYFEDMSGNGNHGYVGGYIDVTDGADGTDEAAEIKEIGDYLTIKHNDMFNFKAEDNYTVDLWFKIDRNKIYSNHTWPCLFTKGSPNATSYFGSWINANSKTGKDSVYFGTGTFDIETNTNVTGNKNAAAYTGVLDEEWHHFIAIQKDGAIYTYIDGKAGATEVAKDITNNWDLYIGGKVGEKEGADLIQQFFGAIDELKIYNRALSIEEITGIYPVEKDESKLVVDLDFAEIKDGVIVDKTGRGNNASLTGDVTVVDGAVVFDTDGEYITIANSADINFASTDNFIIEFKYRIDNKGGSWPCVMSKGDKGIGWYGVWVNNGMIWGGDTGNYTVAPLTIGEWHTMQVVRDAEKKEMYVFIDGNLSAQITTALGFESAFDLFIGAATYSGNGKGDTLKVQQFFGAIDDFKVYDYGTDALTYTK
jgi:hypothetical protein